MSPGWLVPAFLFGCFCGYTACLTTRDDKIEHAINAPLHSHLAAQQYVGQHVAATFSYPYGEESFTGRLLTVASDEDGPYVQLEVDADNSVHIIRAPLTMLTLLD